MLPQGTGRRLFTRIPNTPFAAFGAYALISLAALVIHAVWLSNQGVAGPVIAPAARVDGALLFTANCKRCHGANGKGDKTRAAVPTIPDFTDLAWHFSRDEQSLMHSVENGNPPLMPPYREKLGRKEIQVLVFYLRSFPSNENEHAAGEHAEPKPNQVHTAFPDLAAAQTRRIADFTDRQEMQNNARWEVSILQGKGNHIPAFQEKIAADQVRNLAVHVRPVAGMSSASPADSNWEKRFEELQMHLRELQEQRELAKPTAKR